MSPAGAHVWMLVGLGNPGPEYAHTRHNVGFEVVDRLAARHSAGPAREKWGAEVAEARLGSQRVLLCKPMEFMNVSGQAVVRLAQFFKVAPEHAVVVHDELDLPLGRLKLAGGGGHGGHNGVRSILAEWGQADFARVRIGIGRPAGSAKVGPGYVLGGFARDERAVADGMCERAADAVEVIVTAGLLTAMNRFNGKAGDGPARTDQARAGEPHPGTVKASKKGTGPE
jgi:PTH1 family peptidyl-tRNA hydrolase